MSRRSSRLGITVVLIACSVGCGSESSSALDGSVGSEDASADAVSVDGFDRGPDDSGSEDGLPIAQKGDVNPIDPRLIHPVTSVPADFSCRGTRMAPRATREEASFSFFLEELHDRTRSADVCFEFYADNLVPFDDGVCDGMMTDGSGHATVVAAAGSWYAYRVFPVIGATPNTTIVGSVEYNRPAPEVDGEPASGNTVARATLNLIPTLLGFDVEPGTAVLAGRVLDCVHEPVYGTRIRLFRRDGTEISEGERGPEPHYRYFDGERLPSPMQPWSHVDGMFVVANVPVGDVVLLELWGRRATDGSSELLGCESAELFSDTVTLLNMGPLRSDGPACPNL